MTSNVQHPDEDPGNAAASANADAAHDSADAPAAAQDVAPLAWVIDEIRTSLNEASGATKNFLANKADVDALRNATEHVHQVSGALQLLDLRGVTLVTEALEQLFALWEKEPDQCMPAAVRAVDATLSGVRNYLDGLLTGSLQPPIRLFPYYREILVLLRAPRVHPADLLFPDLSRRPAFHQMAVRALSADELRIRRVLYEEGLLRFLRDPDNASARGRMRDAVFELEGLPQRGLARSFWWVARGMFDALDSFQLPVDADLKRFLARLNQQFRRQIEGGPVVSERMMVDALYHVGRADEKIERVAQVKQLYGLNTLLPADFERATLTTTDTEALAALRDALNQSKLLWGQLMASSTPDTGRFRAEATRAQASALRLGAPAPARVLGCIIEATTKLANASPVVRDAIGMEVATALLLLETGAEGYTPADPQFEQRADAMIDRVMRAADGMPLPESDPWIADLARRAQERSSMDTVVAEMRTMLREAELQLDKFFRDPSQRKDLAALEPMFEQVGGVLGVLGFEDPAAALRNVRESVQRFADPATPANPEEFARIAQVLGAIGFFVGTLTQEPTHPRGMFHFDRQSGTFSANMGLRAQTAAPVDDASDFIPPAPHSTGKQGESENVEGSIERLMASARAAADRLVANPGDRNSIAQLAPVLAQLVNDSDLTDDADLRSRAAQASHLLDELRQGRGAPAARALQELLKPVVAAVPAPTAPMPDSASAADRELHEIFVEEADEVLESVGVQLARLRKEPADSATLTMARRAFHTLKGSSRMVGLKDFGEFAWALEQCFNVWLAQERPANADLLNLASASADRMRDWIEALRNDPTANVDASPLIHAAHVVRDGGKFELPYTLDQEEIVDPHANTIEVAAAPPPASEEEIDEDVEEVAAQVPAGTPMVETTPEPQAASEAAPADDAQDEMGEDSRRVGPLVISHGLYSVFLNESDECVRALAQEIGEWRYEANKEVSSVIVRRAHTLAGISDTVGIAPVSAIADPLDALMQHLRERRGTSSGLLNAPQFDVLERAIERMRGMLHQFAAGEYPDEAPLEAGAVRDMLAVVRAQPVPPSEPFPDTVPLPLIDARELGAITQIARNPWTAAREPAAQAPAPAPVVPPIPASKDLAADLVPNLGVNGTGDGPESSSEEEPEAEAEGANDAPVATSVRDEIDEELLQVFTIEAQDLLPAIAKGLRAIGSDPNQRDLARNLMRQFHTLKGSARMAGAMRLGEVVHEMETRIESAMQHASMPATVIEDLQTQYDHAVALFDELQNGPVGAPIPPVAPGPAFTVPASTPVAAAPAPAPAVARAPTPLEAAPKPVTPPPVPQTAPPVVAHSAPQILVPQAATPAPIVQSPSPSSPPPQRVAAVEATTTAGATRAPGAPAAAQFIRVRADVVDRLVDHAGEVSIARSKLESEVGALRGSLTDLTENIQRLRSQLREVELQADAQIQARSDQVAKQSSTFDPLEFDRYSRLQELTRLLAESVEDVALVQSNMLKGLQLADNDLTAQSRLTRELQQQLMSVRLVPFANVSERLYRVARQAAKELDKRVHLDILGSETEVDRSLLEQMAGPFEHLVRNSIVHGLESPTERLGAGKSDTGELRIEVRKEGNEIVVVFADDGAGLDLERIRARAIAVGLLAPERKVDDRETIELIFSPGLSTAKEVTELAGRGVGMDVVREQVSGLGGRIAVSTERGRGARFTLYLPMTLSIMQVVLATLGERRYALPAAMVDQVRRVRARELAAALQRGAIEFPEVGEITLRPLTQLLGVETVIGANEQYSVALLRLGDDRLAVCVDDLSANQEVVVKNVGPQVARLAGVLGATVLGNGQVVLIINPVQLISRAPEPPTLDEEFTNAPAERTPSGKARLSTVAGATVMVVDDSLTVRRVTQRLLERNGYRTILAKDGVDALRELQEHSPDVMLVDIEMPRMDGYDLTRNVRSSSATRGIPIIMITSRTAEKHRRVAFELGVNEYLGKPYREDELLELVRRYVQTANEVRAANAAANA
jgi:chemosensory pili system protein ChpA (sensor histidine kinase/response regulator)